jgi:GT2 family glycosyltransferase
MIRVAIVFPIFNGLQYTKSCLTSLFIEHNIEIIKNVVFVVVIVDDGSTDESSEWIRVNFPQVKLLTGNGNLWWSGGINLAVKYAISDLHADYILWWNNDIFGGANYFNNLSELLDPSEIKTIIGSKIYHAHDKNIIWSMGGTFDVKTGFKSLIATAEADQIKYESIIDCDWLPGMGTITHKSVYEKIGWLDEKNFPQYHGDSDFTLRAKQNGFKIIVNPLLKIYNDTLHSGLRHNNSAHGLIQSLFSIKSNYNIQKDFIFYRKHCTTVRAYKFLILKYYKYIGGFIKWKILGIIGKDRR